MPPKLDVGADSPPAKVCNMEKTGLSINHATSHLYVHLRSTTARVRPTSGVVADTAASPGVATRKSTLKKLPCPGVKSGQNRPHGKLHRKKCTQNPKSTISLIRNNMVHLTRNCVSLFLENCLWEPSAGSRSQSRKHLQWSSRSAAAAAVAQ